MIAFMRNLRKRALALILALCLCLCLPGLELPAAAADALTLVYSQSVDGEVHLGITGVDPAKVIYGVQLEVALDGEYLPENVRLDPEHGSSAFSPTFSTLVKKEEGRTTVALYLVSDYALNNQREIRLGALFAEGLPIAPLSARAALLDSDQLHNGGELEFQDLPMSPAPGAQAWGPSSRIKRTVTAGEGEIGISSPGTARENQTVFVQVAPKEGYQLESLQASEGVVLIPAGEGEYSFKMPGHEVELRASFKKKDQEPLKPLFSDVKEGDWFYPAVEYAYTNGLMNGIGGGKFGPNEDTSRGMLVTILYRREGSPAVDGRSGFSDVADGQWYTDAVTWASENGIVNGYSGNVFRPASKISRQEIAAILYRYAKYKGYDLTAGGDLSAFPDAGQVGEFAREPLKWAVGKEYITGKSGKLDPKGSAIRAQSATILQRFFTGL